MITNLAQDRKKKDIDIDNLNILFNKYVRVTASITNAIRNLTDQDFH